MITKELLSAALNISQEPNGFLWQHLDVENLKKSNYFITDVKTTANRIVSLAAKNELVRIAEQEAKAAKSPLYLGFYLSMPNNNSWNNKWSGAGGKYVVTLKVPNKSRKQRESLIDKSFSYSFGDGWRASVQIKQLSAQEARKEKKESLGFYGYDWMIASILKDGYITTEQDEIENATHEMNS